MLPVHPSMRCGVVINRQNELFLMYGAGKKDLPFVEKPGWQEIILVIKMETSVGNTERGLGRWMHHVVYARVG